MMMSQVIPVEVVVKMAEVAAAAAAAVDVVAVGFEVSLVVVRCQPCWLR